MHDTTKASPEPNHGAAWGCLLCTKHRSKHSCFAVRVTGHCFYRTPGIAQCPTVCLTRTRTFSFFLFRCFVLTVQYNARKTRTCLGRVQHHAMSAMPGVLWAPPMCHICTSSIFITVYIIALDNYRTFGFCVSTLVPPPSLRLCDTRIRSRNCRPSTAPE